MKMWSLKSIQLKYYQLETFNLNGLFPIGWGIIDHIKHVLLYEQFKWMMDVELYFCNIIIEYMGICHIPIFCLVCVIN